MKEDMFSELPSSHGVAGKVVSVALPNIVVLDRDGTEKTIVTTDKTIARRFRDTLALKDITVDDFVVAIGEPNEASQIEARLIRLLPEPPTTQNPIQQPTNPAK
jgi:hypothetical protein